MGLLVETLNSHMDVSSQVGVCVIDMALEGAAQAIGVQWHVAPTCWVVGAGALTIFRDGAAVNHTRLRRYMIEATMAASLARHGIYRR